MWCAPAWRAALTVSASCSGPSERPGRIGAMATFVRMPASTSRRDDLEPLAGRRRARLGRAPDAVVERRHRDVDGHLGPPGSLLEHVDIAPDERAARDDRGRGARPRELDDARPGEAVAPFGGLVRVGRGADRHLLARPGAAGELGAEDVGDVRLDADRAAVAVVGGAIGPLLEGADVTERAAVDAAGVRVQRPGERHPLDAVQRGAARLLAVLDGHEPL